MKFYTRRDSATSVLRKLGIKPRDYDLFITKVSDGVELDDELAKKHATNIKAQTTKPKKKPVKKPAKPKDGKAATISGTAYEMILDGASNQEVWEVIQPMFNLDEKKRHYPSWYRCHLRRIGKLSQDTRVKQSARHVVYE